MSTECDEERRRGGATAAKLYEGNYQQQLSLCNAGKDKVCCRIYESLQKYARCTYTCSRNVPAVALSIDYRQAPKLYNIAALRESSELGEAADVV